MSMYGHPQIGNPHLSAVKEFITNRQLDVSNLTDDGRIVITGSIHHHRTNQEQETLEEKIAYLFGGAKDGANLEMPEDGTHHFKLNLTGKALATFLEAEKLLQEQQGAGQSR